jgi:Family of unknown function (DUF6317)
MSGGDGGFTVVMSALQSTAEAFDSESKTLAGLVPEGGPAVPDGGNGAIDGAMHSVVSKIGELNQALSQAMAAHGQKLSTAYDNYSKNEIALTQLSQELSAALLPNACYATPSN